MATEAREHEERGHSARYLVLIFLVCVATCGVFFSLGFLVGYNERASRAAPSTEVINGPAVVPPTVNPSPESAQVTPQDSAAHPSVNPVPETVVVPGSAGANPAAPPATPADTLPPGKQPKIPTAGLAKSAPNPPRTPAPSAGAVGEGVTVQVVAVRTKQDAEQVVSILKKEGYPVFLVTPEYAHAADNLFRVQVGPFRTRDDAEKVRAKLAQEGFKPFIRH
jgi:DedD protein